MSKQDTLTQVRPQDDASWNGWRPASSAAPATSARSTKNTRSAKATGRRQAEVGDQGGSGSGAGQDRPHAVRRVGMMALNMLVRLGALAICWAVVMVTATSVIPMLAAWLHAQSGLSAEGTTNAAVIGMWVAPLFFLSICAALAVAALCRWIWGRGSALITAARTRIAPGS